MLSHCMRQTHLATVTALQILVKSLPADAKLLGNLGLTDPRADPLTKLHNSFSGKRFFPSLIGALAFSERYPLPLAFFNEGPFKFGKGTHNVSVRPGTCG